MAMNFLSRYVTLASASATYYGDERYGNKSVLRYWHRAVHATLLFLYRI